MNVLIGCERSGVIREAFRSRGHEAWFCDLEPAEDRSPFHYQIDIFDLLSHHALIDAPVTWDLFICHPECRYLCSSGLHHNVGNPERQKQTAEALDFALKLWAVPIRRKCMENSVGRLTRVMREKGAVIQCVQPYQFGHDASKNTALILDNLPPLIPTCNVAPRIVNGRPRWANQTDSGQNRLAPSPTRSMDRARTYFGIADAMADQWGTPADLFGAAA